MEEVEDLSEIEQFKLWNFEHRISSERENPSFFLESIFERGRVEAKDVSPHFGGKNV